MTSFLLILPRLFLVTLLLETQLSLAFTPLAQPSSSSSSSSLRQQQHHYSRNTLLVRSVTPVPNEFVRTFDVDRSLKRHGNQQRHSTVLTATPEECQALAKRFDLPRLDALAADLSVRRAASGDDGLFVEGTIAATVTRICVRTNEPFDQEIQDMALLAIVRPVVPIAQLVAQQVQLEQQFSPDNSNKKNRNKKDSNSNARNQFSNRNVDDMDILELQRFLQADIQDEEDILMEDENIYTTEGVIDLGELVAQLFWLGLDPYPKKPGSEPIQTRITG